MPCCRGRGLRGSARARVQAKQWRGGGCERLGGRPAGCQKTLKTVDVCNRQRCVSQSACSSHTELGLPSARGAGAWRARARQGRSKVAPSPTHAPGRLRRLGLESAEAPVERCDAGPSPLLFHCVVRSLAVLRAGDGQV